jgi:hypothetical protein
MVVAQGRFDDRRRREVVDGREVLSVVAVLFCASGKIRLILRGFR